jgi:DNA-binding transcriptional MerR regulator
MVFLMGRITEEKFNRIYSRKDVFEELRGIVDISEREISYWMDLQIVVPDIANPKGQGKTRYHSFCNLIDFAIAKKLALSGMNLKTIKSVMDYLRSDKRRDNYMSDKDNRLIVTNPNTETMRVYFERTDPLPSSGTKAVISRIAENIALRKLSEEMKREIIMVSESFETLFIFNITPLVKRLRA